MRRLFLRRAAWGGLHGGSGCLGKSLLPLTRGGRAVAPSALVAPAHSSEKIPFTRRGCDKAFADREGNQLGRSHWWDSGRLQRISNLFERNQRVDVASNAESSIQKSV
ncbi:hypothetical protein D3C85_1580290 [compost metagenome]